MYTINCEYKNEIEVDRSSFISYLIPCNDDIDAKNFLVITREIIEQQIRDIDVDNLTPLQALTVLCDLKKQLEE